MDLAEGHCTEHARKVAETSDVSTEELENAYRAVHSIDVATNPLSDLSELDYTKQAAHFFGLNALQILWNTEISCRFLPAR